jgi:hypothetical protein
VHRTTQWRRPRLNTEAPSPYNPTSRSVATATSPNAAHQSLRASVAECPDSDNPTDFPTDYQHSPHTSCTELVKGVDRGRHSPV